MNPAEDNPYRPPQSTAIPQDRPPSPGGTSYTTAVWLLLGTIAVGVPLSVYDVESIVGSGVVVMVLAIWIVFRAFRRRLTWGLGFGSEGIVICLVCAGLINLLNWSPSDAQWPIPLILTVYAIIAMPCGIAALYENRPSRAHDVMGPPEAVPEP